MGPILEWDLDLDQKKIAVNTENFETNKDGIFAVGDINNYPGKLDLILCGFHETTLAVQKGLIISYWLQKKRIKAFYQTI